MDLSKRCIIIETNPPSLIFNNQPAHGLWFVNILKRIKPDLKIEVYNVTNNIFPKTIRDTNGIIITGSSKEVYDNELWIKNLKTHIRH